MEGFQFDVNGDELIIKNPKRNLYISAFYIGYIPEEHPPQAIACFCVFDPQPGSRLAQDKQTFMAFIINDPDKIEYEPYLTGNLIYTAISTFSKTVLGQGLGEVTFSPGYKKRYIDSLPTDPDKLSPELREFIASGEASAGTDFYEWKEIKRQAASN